MGKGPQGVEASTIEIHPIFVILILPPILK